MNYASVVYDSKFGNTEHIALKLASLLEGHGFETVCMKVGNVDLSRFTESKVLALGGPTHNFGPSQPMRDFLDGLNGMSLHGKKVFAFDTRFDSPLSGSAAKYIEARLLEHGAHIAVPRYSAFVTTRGVLKEDGIEEALGQAAMVLAKQALAQSKGGDQLG